MCLCVEVYFAFAFFPDQSRKFRGLKRMLNIIYVPCVMCNIWYIVNNVFICFFYFWSNNVWIKPYVTLCCQWQPTNKSTTHCRSPLQHLSSNSVLRLIPLRVGKNIIGLHWNTKIRQLAWSQCSNNSLKGDQNLVVGNLHRDRSVGGMREVCCVSRVAST